MRWRMTAVLLLGAWLAGTLWMWTAATRNFALVDGILAAPPAGLSALWEPLEPGAPRAVLRYQASEANRMFFAGWGWAQLVLGAGFAAAAWAAGAGRAVQFVAIAALAAAAAEQFFVVPPTIELGRQMDFGAAPAEIADRFWTYHHLYTGLDMAKFLSLLGAAAALVRAGGRNA